MGPDQQVVQRISVGFKDSEILEISGFTGSGFTVQGLPALLRRINPPEAGKPLAAP